MLCQRCRIADPCVQRRCIGNLRRLDDPDDGELLSVFHKLSHIILVVCFISPDVILAVILIVIRAVHKPESDPQDIVIRIFSHVRRGIHILLIDKLADHLIQLQRVAQPHSIQHEITHTPAGSEHQHTLVIILRPAPCLYIILPFIKVWVLRHLTKHIRTHHGGHHTV